jgi:hypothetical protein
MSESTRVDTSSNRVPMGGAGRSGTPFARSESRAV